MADPTTPVDEVDDTTIATAEDETEAAMQMTKSGRNARKVRDGIVVSDKMDKTVVVRVERRVKHPRYHKFVTQSTRYKAHDETNDAGVGDLVRIIETRPLSKDKRFRVHSILERAK